MTHGQGNKFPKYEEDPTNSLGGVCGHTDKPWTPLILDMKLILENTIRVYSTKLIFVYICPISSKKIRQNYIKVYIF